MRYGGILRHDVWALTGYFSRHDAATAGQAIHSRWRVKQEESSKCAQFNSNCIHPNVLHSVTFLILILEDSTMDPDIRKYIDEGCALNSEYFQDETYAYTDVSFSRHELWAL